MQRLSEGRCRGVGDQYLLERWPALLRIFMGLLGGASMWTLLDVVDDDDDGGGGGGSGRAEFKYDSWMTSFILRTHVLRTSLELDCKDKQHAKKKQTRQPTVPLARLGAT